MRIITSTVITLALTVSAWAADVSTKISDVHICCDSCVKGAQKAVADIKGLTAVIDKDDETVSLTAADKATVQKGVDALVKAGFYGKSSEAGFKIDSTTGAKGQKVASLKVKGVHLCCGKCVRAVKEALGTVPGVTSNTAVKDAKTFEVTGDFNDKEVFTALQKAGLTGTVE